MNELRGKLEKHRLVTAAVTVANKARVDDSVHVLVGSRMKLTRAHGISAEPQAMTTADSQQITNTIKKIVAEVAAQRQPKTPE